MKGTRWENFKSAALAVLIGILAAIGVPWVNLTGQIIGGWIVAQMVWVFLVAFDETERQRREGRKKR